MTKSKRGIRSDLKKVDAHSIHPSEYDDAPELTDEQLAAAEVRIGARKPGRPKAESTKVQVTLRLDKIVIDAFKETGDGWQTRINDALLMSPIVAVKRSDVVFNAKQGHDFFISVAFTAPDSWHCRYFRLPSDGPDAFTKLESCGFEPMTNTVTAPDILGARKH